MSIYCFGKETGNVIKVSKVIESFDLAEILFRQNIRLIKKQLTSVDIPKQLASKK